MKKAFLINTESRRTTIRVPEDIHKELRIRSAEADMSFNAYVIHCLEAHLIGKRLTDERLAMDHRPAE